MEVPETERYRHILKPQRSKQPHWGQIKVWTRACHGQAGCSGPRSGHVGNTEQDRARAVDSHAYLASVCPTTAYDTDTSLCTGATGSGPMPCTPVISLCTLSAAALPLMFVPHVGTGIQLCCHCLVTWLTTAAQTHTGHDAPRYG